MRYFTANRETGMRIEEVATVEQGKALIAKYEEKDKTEDVFEEDFYDVVDEDGCTQIWK